MHAYVYVFVCTILCDLFGAAWDQSWEALPMAISVLPYPDGSCVVDDRFQSVVLGILYNIHDLPSGSACTMLLVALPRT